MVLAFLILVQNYIRNFFIIFLQSPSNFIVNYWVCEPDYTSFAREFVKRVFVALAKHFRDIRVRLIIQHHNDIWGVMLRHIFLKLTLLRAFGNARLASFLSLLLVPYISNFLNQLPFLFDSLFFLFNLHLLNSINFDQLFLFAFRLSYIFFKVYPWFFLKEEHLLLVIILTILNNIILIIFCNYRPLNLRLSNSVNRWDLKRHTPNPTAQILSGRVPHVASSSAWEPAHRILRLLVKSILLLLQRLLWLLFLQVNGYFKWHWDGLTYRVFAKRDALDQWLRDFVLLLESWDMRVQFFYLNLSV